MKKTFLLFTFLLAAVGASAQFEQGKWFVNPAITGLELTYSKAEDARFGMNAKGGAFVVDNLALLVNIGAEFNEEYNKFAAGVGGRYYIDAVGIFLGAGFDISRYTKINRTDFELTPELGYAFFISRTVTIEPSVYYRWNTRNNDLSRFGIQVGFGIYF